MYVKAVGTALPQRRFTKSDCWHAFTHSSWFERLDARAHVIAKAVLSHDNGIDERWLSVDSLDEVFEIDPDTLHRRFAAHAPDLASRAARAALCEAKLDGKEIGAVIVSTCTGYLCPALSGYVVESLDLSKDVLCFDLVGQGCAGAIPNWQVAAALVAGQQIENVLSICVEVCSAAMYLDNDPGVLISACLFGDGAGAAVLSRSPGADRRPIKWHATESLINPDQREALRFESRSGLLRNVLTRAVPVLAAEHASRVLQAALAKCGVRRRDITAWIMHAGGRDVLVALQSKLDLDPRCLTHSRDALRRYGNLSSAFVYFVLEAAIRERAPGGWWWMSSFGAGFSCHGALLQVD
jgi:predicted naringenin-chalcone synthase